MSHPLPLTTTSRATFSLTHNGASPIFLSSDPGDLEEHALHVGMGGERVFLEGDTGGGDPPETVADAARRHGIE